MTLNQGQGHRTEHENTFHMPCKKATVMASLNAMSDIILLLNYRLKHCQVSEAVVTLSEGRHRTEKILYRPLVGALVFAANLMGIA